MQSSQAECQVMMYQSNENGSRGTEVTFKQTVTAIHFSGKINPGEPGLQEI